VRDLTPAERVGTSLRGAEPDRVPWFLLVTMHGARELGLSIEEYFSEARHVAEGQLRMRARYRHDCLYGFFYAAVEAEAWGIPVVYRDDGPPVSGEPLVRRAEDVLRLEAPRVHEQACLRKVLAALQEMKARSRGEVPVIGVVMSPFSLPVMQLGFERYLDVLHERPDLFARLMALNEEFCVEWANAQLAAGADALAYFDPVASPSMVPRERYLATGFEVDRRTLSRIRGPAAFHFASARGLALVDDVARTSAAIVTVSALEDVAAVKAACHGRLAVLGNLNALEMRRWTAAQADERVSDAIARGGRGGRFILGDNHGEIPWQVPEAVLETVAGAVERHGRYSLA
jgi:uroporphyrinogen decarboxylase